MKRTALTGLFLTAALLGSPVFAAEDLCAANLQTLKDAQTSSNTAMDAAQQKELEKVQADAMTAQNANDDKKCIEITTKAITEMKTTGSGNQGGTNK
jgi:nitric oxide reductase large subunit